MQRGTAGTQPPARHTQRGGKLTAQEHYTINKKESQEGTKNEHNRRFDPVVGRGMEQRSHCSRGRNERAEPRHRGIRSLEQGEGITMAKIFDYAGRVLLTVSLIAILGTVCAVDKSAIGLTEGMVQLATFFATGVLGGFMMKIGGRR